MAKVKALKSFEFGGRIVHPWDSEVFEIPAMQVAEFVALGLVFRVAEDGAPKPDEVTEEGAAAATLRGRKPAAKQR